MEVKLESYLAERKVSYWAGHLVYQLGTKMADAKVERSEIWWVALTERMLVGYLDEERAEMKAEMKAEKREHRMELMMEYV